MIGAETSDWFQELSLGSDASEAPRNHYKVLARLLLFWGLKVLDLKLCVGD